jgi:hypothetical protein
LVPAIVRELRNALDEILLMGLPERKPVKPTLAAQLAKADCLTRVRKNNEQPVDLFTGTGPSWAAAGTILFEHVCRFSCEDQPGACI